MKVSEVLKQAKQHLWDGGTRAMCHIGVATYICHSIENAAYIRGLFVDNSRDYAPYKRAKRIIHQRIAPHYDLDSWVRKNVKGSYKVLNKADGEQQMQAYRHRWLDALIKEFESLGE